MRWIFDIRQAFKFCHYYASMLHEKVFTINQSKIWPLEQRDTTTHPQPTYYAFKSSGNGKAYYVQPIVHNLASQLAPIFQSQLWFPWYETVGLVDGDVIAIEGQTTKFLCKALDSPDSANRLDFAIKYVA